MFLKYQQPINRRFRAEDDGAGGEGGASPTIEELTARLDELTPKAKHADELAAENERLNAKIQEANKHKKNAEREVAEAARKKAEDDGNFEQLFQSSQNENQTLRDQLEGMQKTTEKKEIGSTALKVAANLAEGHNVDLMSGFIAKRLKIVDDAVKVVDEKGNLTVSTLAELENEFRGSARFESLIKGNQSSGGGANGGSNDSGAAKTITRAEFDALSQTDRKKYSVSGGKVTD